MNWLRVPDPSALFALGWDSTDLCDYSAFGGEGLRNIGSEKQVLQPVQNAGLQDDNQVWITYFLTASGTANPLHTSN